MTKTMTPKRPLEAATGMLQVLDRTCTILEHFTVNKPEWTTSELARSCALPVPTVHRIMTTLLHRGFVVRHKDTKRFRLGPKLVVLGDRARGSLDLRTISLPVLRRLVVETGETALLTILNETRDRSVCLERVESPAPLRLSVQPGRELPLHAGAMQKALAAFMPTEDIVALLSSPLERLCDSTITDPEALRRDLVDTHERGWAFSMQETNVGVAGVAVPVRGPDNELVAAIGLAGPNARFTRAHVPEYVGRLRVAATAVAAALGA